MPKTANDPFFAVSTEPNYAGRHAIAVTPSDTADLPVITKQLFVAVGGTVAVIFADDPDSGSVSLGTQAAGVTLVVQVRRVMATGTSATVVAVWG